MECADFVKASQTAISIFQAGLRTQMNGFPTCGISSASGLAMIQSRNRMDDGIQGLVSFRGWTDRELMDL